MANICKYRVRVKGSRKVCHFVFSAFPSYDEKYIVSESGNDDLHVTEFQGDCKWYVGAYCDKKWRGKAPIDLSAFSDEALEKGEVTDFWEYSPEQLSKMTGAKIEYVSWSQDDAIQTYCRIYGGKTVTNTKARYHSEKDLNFNKLSLSVDGTEADDDPSMRKLYINDGVLSTNATGAAGEEVFRYRINEKSVCLPEGLISIGGSVGNRLGFLVSRIQLPDSLKRIEDEAFECCYKLSEINLPDGIEYIGKQAFYACGIKSITLPKSLKEIGAEAFRQCEALTELTLPEGLEVIGERAFFKTDKLRQLLIPETVRVLGDGFVDAPVYGFKGEITIPPLVESISPETFAQSKGLKAIHVSEASAHFQSIKGVLFSKDGSTLLRYPAGSRTKRYAVPAGVRRIAEKAFAYSQYIEEITMPESLEDIGAQAFTGCEGLKRLTGLPQTVAIHAEAFGDLRAILGENSLDATPPECIRADLYRFSHVMAAGGLKQYVLTPESWGTFDVDQQVAFLMEHDGKTLMPAYRKCVTTEQANDIGMALLETLKGKPKLKECKTVAFYLDTFRDIAPLDVCKQLYEQLKLTPGAQKALAMIEQAPGLIDQLTQ